MLRNVNEVTSKFKEASLTVFVHASVNAFLESTGATLVSVSLVHGAGSLPGFTDVLSVSPY